VSQNPPGQSVGDCSVLVAARSSFERPDDYDDENYGDDVLGEIFGVSTQLLSWCLLGGFQWAAPLLYLVLRAVFVGLPTIANDAAWERTDAHTGDGSGYESALLGHLLSGGSWVFINAV
jgi:hypothetical protein